MNKLEKNLNKLEKNHSILYLFLIMCWVMLFSWGNLYFMIPFFIFWFALSIFYVYHLLNKERKKENENDKP